MFNNIEDITSTSYDSIKYLVNSDLRINILELLYDKECDFEEIKGTVLKQESNILITLKELQDLKLIEHSNKIYKLSSAGYLTIRNLKTVIDNFYVLNKLRKCWNVHNIDNIPLHFSRYLYLWKDGFLTYSDYVEYYKSINFYVEKIKQSKEIRIILPIFSKLHIAAILDTINKNNATLELITSNDILNAIKTSEYNELFEKLRTNGSIKLYLSNNNIHKIFYTVADNFAALTLFYLDDSYDDSVMLFNDNMNHYDIFVSLFEDYKSMLK